MPPRRYSRYTFATATRDDAGRLFLTDVEPYGYQPLSDNRQHVVGDGDTLFSLAAQYFAPLPRPAGLWWIIGHFQPDPIHDPTQQLDRGRVLVIPSLQTVNEIFSESRRDEAGS